MMKDLLKHTIACRIAGCLAAFCLTFVSCTSTVDDGLQDSRAITFTPAADTRAAVTGFEDMGDFQVWGWHGADGANTYNIFDATVVYKDADWNYTDGVRYWKAGETYNFYAVYPVFPQSADGDGTKTTATVNSSGEITVTGFDCSATGTKTVDLMTATHTRTLSNPIEDDETSAVTIQFHHLLSKVNIVATVEGGNVEVTNITFAGMVTSGDYSSTDGWNNTATGSFTNPTDQTLNMVGVDLLGDMLLIPQDVSGFTVTVDYTMDGATQPQKKITLPTTISRWEAGQSYKYTLAFKGNNIIFTVNVASWNHSTGGIITVE